MGKSFDLICVGMALVDSLIRGFDPEPVSAAGYRAVSGTLSAGGEAVNEAVAAAKAEIEIFVVDDKEFTVFKVMHPHVHLSVFGNRRRIRQDLVAARHPFGVGKQHKVRDKTDHRLRVDA